VTLCHIEICLSIPYFIVSPVSILNPPRIAYCGKPQVASCRLQVASYRLQVADCRSMLKFSRVQINSVLHIAANRIPCHSECSEESFLCRRKIPHPLRRRSGQALRGFGMTPPTRHSERSEESFLYRRKIPHPLRGFGMTTSPPCHSERSEESFVCR